MRHGAIFVMALALAVLVRFAPPALAEAAPKAEEPAAAEVALDEGQEEAPPATVEELPPLPGEGPAAAAPAPTAPAAGKLAPGETIHKVVKGDTLWDLSAKYLGSPWRWKAIWERNRFLTNPHFIYPGTKVLVIPPPLREYPLAGGAPPPAAVAAPPPAAPAVAPPASPAAPKGPPVLAINPEDFVRAGHLAPAVPENLGRVRGARSSMVDYTAGDVVYLSLKKEIPPGQLLGAYRVRGPLSLPGKKKGYVTYLVGVVEVTGKQGKYHLATVRKSYEELGEGIYLSEQIPSFEEVVLRGTSDRLAARVVATRLQNKELSTGDFVYLDRGSDAGVALGDRFRLVDPRREDGAPLSAGKALLPRAVATAVVVRVSGPYSTAYVVDSVRSFQVGVTAVGEPDPSAR